MAAPVVLFRSVVALVDLFPVLAGVDLAVDPGETLLLTGANGAGKTSLLRTIAGLISVSQGTAEVLGHDLSADRSKVRRRIGFLGHQSFLYGELSVEDNVRFAVKASGAAVTGIDAAIERAGLSGRLRATTVDRLSAGQRRRVALAILLARDPELWLLDEPHASFDAEGRELIDQVIRESNRTVILSSHEADRAMKLADRQIEIVGGAVAPPVVDLAHVKEATRVS